MFSAFRSISGAVVFSALLLCSASQLHAAKPAHLTTDSLVQPLGIDTEQPLFSWQLQDAAFGARQTAYRLRVATSPALLKSAKPDAWDSGVVKSDQSVGIKYAGPPLKPQQRYYWQVESWDKDGKAYPASDVTWWETGLMNAGWKAKWIGYEIEEHRRIRESGAKWITNVGDERYKGSGDTHHEFRVSFNAAKAIQHATLYVTAKDTVSAWVNGKQVVTAQPLPPWKQMPWQTYLIQDVTPQMQQGANLLAVEATLYSTNDNGAGSPDDDHTPMSACLYLEMTDGSIALLKTGDPGWKGALNVKGSWQTAAFNDASWKDAGLYTPPASAFGTAPPGNPWPTGPVKALRHSFNVQHPVTSARLYITALGAYQVQINGHRVGDQVLAPGWMDFRIHVPYQVYDVTADVKAGPNAIGAYLAPGWYTTPLMWFRQGYNYGNTPPALKAQLRIAHSDGSVEWIETDETWKADVSPILKAEIYDGETFDARRIQPGWDTASFSDQKWKPVELIQPTEPQIVAQSFEPIRIEKSIAVKQVTSPAHGTYIYDFGQNLSGFPKIRVKGAAGTDVQLRFAEVLNPDGTMYVDNLRTAKATDHFILSGKGTEEYQPTFTFHGFRYLEVTGLADKLPDDAVQALVIHTDAPFTAQLKTGSDMINQLWSNILWGQRSNFVGVPTDCPQRDERLGWTADAQVFWRAASYNMNLAQFSKKFGGDLRGTQTGTPMYGIFAPGALQPNPGYGAGWSDAGVIIPWTSWVQSGDTRIISENWDAMEKYLNAILADNPDFLWKKNSGIPFGDWLSPEGKTQQPLLATAYWAYDVTLMQQMAHALGNADAEKRYADLFSNIRQAFAKAFVQSDGTINGADNSASPFGQINNPDAMAKGGSTQTGYVLALYMNLVPDSLRAASADKLVEKIKANDWKLGTGFLGTPYLLAVLEDTGHSEVAYRLLLNTEYPSWGYLVGHGATTMWERWNGDQMRNDPSMNSYNHYAYGAVADWIYRYSAGIDTWSSDAGFHTIYLHPSFNSKLGSIDFKYESPYGEIKSAWVVKGSDVDWTVTIPANTTARLPLPAARVSAYTIDGKPLADNKNVSLLSEESGTKVFKLAAGTYAIKTTTP
jgi:alpha-L-rhamnosidase